MIVNINNKNKKENNMKNVKTNQNQSIAPWWFWGCDKESYQCSFENTLAATIQEEDSRANRDAWEDIENGRL